MLTTPCIFEGEGSDRKEREIDRQTEIKPSWEVYQKEDVIFIATQFYMAVHFAISLLRCYQESTFTPSLRAIVNKQINIP